MRWGRTTVASDQWPVASNGNGNDEDRLKAGLRRSLIELCVEDGYLTREWVPVGGWHGCKRRSRGPRSRKAQCPDVDRMRRGALSARQRCDLWGTVRDEGVFGRCKDWRYWRVFCCCWRR